METNVYFSLREKRRRTQAVSQRLEDLDRAGKPASGGTPGLPRRLS
jgi:hypothetical protein